MSRLSSALGLSFLALALALVLVATACLNRRASGDDDDDDNDSAASSDDDDSAPGDDDDTSADLPGPFTFSNAVLIDGGQNGVWNELETLFIQVDMTNEGEDFFNYPGALLSCDHSLVAIKQEDSWLFGLENGQSNMVAFTVDAEAGLTIGEDITFTVSASVLSCDTNPDQDCPDPNPFTIEHTFGDPL